MSGFHKQEHIASSSVMK